MCKCSTNTKLGWYHWPCHTPDLAIRLVRILQSRNSKMSWVVLILLLLQNLKVTIWCISNISKWCRSGWWSMRIMFCDLLLGNHNEKISLSSKQILVISVFYFNISHLKLFWQCLMKYYRIQMTSKILKKKMFILIY